MDSKNNFCKIFLIFVLLAGCVLTACNDDVFVSRPEPEVPAEEPEDPGEPSDTNLIYLKTISYNSVEVAPNDCKFSTTTTIVNRGEATQVHVLYDNYNQSIVTIYNTTCYVHQWAPQQEQPWIIIPGLDAEGTPGFYGTEMPFAFGKTIVYRQYMPGHEESHNLPANSQITATIYYTRRMVIGEAEMVYYLAPWIDSPFTGQLTVSVEVPVDIQVEWGEVTPAD